MGYQLFNLSQDNSYTRFFLPQSGVPNRVVSSIIEDTAIQELQQRTNNSHQQINYLLYLVTSQNYSVHSGNNYY